MLQLTSLPAQIVADTIVRTVELGLAITDAALAGDTTVVFAELLVDGPGACPDCGLAGVYRDTTERRVTDVPVVGHPLELRVRVPRYACRHDGCARAIFAHDSSRLARPGASTTRRAATFILRRLAVDKATVSAVARELGRSWDTVNSIAVAATQTLLLCAGSARLDGVEVLGVDEHKWSHVLGRRTDPDAESGGGFVTVITDLTAVVAGTGPARLLDMVPGRSAAAFAGWLAAREQGFRDRVKIVAMYGFGGYKNAAVEAVPDAVTVMDPFHVVALCGAKLDLCRQRVQQDTLGHRGRRGDPLYGVRRTLRTRRALLSETGRARITTVFDDLAHAAVEATWVIYQQMTDAYAREDRTRGKNMLTELIDRLRTGPPARLDELATLGRTLHRRRDRRPGLLRPPRLQRPHRGHQQPASKRYHATPWASATRSTTTSDLYCTAGTSHSDSGRAGIGRDRHRLG